MGPWSIKGRALALDERTHIMGILNVTPDSFSDGGDWLDTDIAVKHAISMTQDGADIIDIGGESTRPGSAPVDAAEETARVIPVIKALAQAVDKPISIDTSKAKVAELAIEAGASIVNDVTAFRGDTDMAAVAAESGAGVVLMHMVGDPRTMQQSPTYSDVVAEVSSFLVERKDAAMNDGIEEDRIILDPGIGFGKTVEHNLRLLRALDDISSEVDSHILVGPSRKSFIGSVLDLEVDQRLEGTSAVVALAVAAGVSVVRVHDVKEMTRVVRMTEAVMGRSDG